MAKKELEEVGIKERKTAEDVAFEEMLDGLPGICRLSGRSQTRKKPVKERVEIGVTVVLEEAKEKKPQRTIFLSESMLQIMNKVGLLTFSRTEMQHIP